jgi:hypothetical protein
MGPVAQYVFKMRPELTSVVGQSPVWKTKDTQTGLRTRIIWHGNGEDVIVFRQLVQDEKGFMLAWVHCPPEPSYRQIYEPSHRCFNARKPLIDFYAVGEGFYD